MWVRGVRPETRIGDDMSDDLIHKARVFAFKAHAGQRYGDEPYAVHLSAVYEVADDFDLPVEIKAAAFLHDVLEDTATSRDDLLLLFGEHVTYLVEAVTGRGPNRRACVLDAHRKIMDYGVEAAVLKLCDRIANAETSQRSRPDLLAMYRREQDAFERVVRSCVEGAKRTPHGQPLAGSRTHDALDDLIGRMLGRLERALRDPGR